MVECSRSEGSPLEPGGMAEWTKAAVLKTAVGQPTGGSNPSPSAYYNVNIVGEVPEWLNGGAC
jgi:hypothetical protein